MGIEVVPDGRQVRPPLFGGLQGFPGGKCQVIDLVGEHLDRVAGESLTVHSQIPDPSVPAQVEQLAQELLSFRGRILQKGGELALRKHDALGEVIESEAEQFLDGGGHLVGAHDRFDPSLQPGFCGGRAGLRSANDPGGCVIVLTNREIESHSRFVPAERHDRLDGRLAEARHHAVQGKEERINETRLAAAGGPHERKEVGALEVQDRFRPERREPLDFETSRPHRSPPGACRTARRAGRHRCCGPPDIRGTALPRVCRVALRF